MVSELVVLNNRFLSLGRTAFIARTKDMNI
jgi:hypothetical protein